MAIFMRHVRGPFVNCNVIVLCMGVRVPKLNLDLGDPKVKLATQMWIRDPDLAGRGSCLQQARMTHAELLYDGP